MTIASTARKAGPFTGNGTATSFPFTFKVFSANDIQVAVADDAGVETVLTLGTHYTVTLNSNQETTPGGTITYPVTGAPLRSGSTLAIIGDVDYDQPLDLPSGGNYSPQALENQLDRIAMQVQQLKEIVGRSLQLSVNSPSGTSTALPPPEANTIVAWNAAANGLQNIDPVTLATVVAFGTAVPDIFTGTDAQTAFTLSANPGALGNLDVAVGGATQLPDVDYFWTSGTSISFAEAPANGVPILVRYIQALPQGVTDSAASTFLPDGGVSRSVQDKLRETVSVKDFGAKGDGSTDDADAIQAAFNAAPVSGTVLFPPGVYALGKMVTQHTSGVTVRGAGKYSTILKPLPSFDRTTYDALLEVGTAATNSHVVQDIAVTATYGSDGNNLSGLALNAAYNVDVVNCYLQSGNHTTRETGGLLIRSGKHTRIVTTHMHNGYGYGAVIASHNVDLRFIACAFDETPVAIKSTGNIVEMSVSDCSFGNCTPNGVYPTPSTGSHIDLTTGSHRNVSVVNNVFGGSAATFFAINITLVELLNVVGNYFGGIHRYAICHRGSKQINVVGNQFYQCGGGGATDDSSLGTSNPDTSPFCCEVFKASAYLRSNTITGNTTDNAARPMCWLEGSASSPSTSAATIFGNNAQGGAARIHGVTVTDSRPFVNGRRLVESLVPVSFTIPSMTYTAGQSQFGNFTYSGLEVTDVLHASAGVALPAGMILNVRVLSAGVGRWIVTNQTGSSQTPAAVTTVASATKA